VIVATDVDPKNPLVKVALEKGRLIEKKVAGRLKDLDLAEIITQTLKPMGKTMSRAAEEVLKDRCGGNMRLIQSELEKLALYVQGPTIEAKDVALLVSHAREEEFLELSDALQRRDWPAALKYVDDALEQGAPPLLLLGAVGSIIRTLLLNHDRLLDGLYGLYRTGLLRRTRILPERHQPKARKGRDHHTCNGIPDLSVHNLLHVSSSSQLPRTTARRRVGPRCLCNSASATLHRPSYHRLTIALSSGGYGCNGGAKIRSRVASSDRYLRALI